MGREADLIVEFDSAVITEVLAEATGAGVTIKS